MKTPPTSTAGLDHAHVWHPFTQMRDWLRSRPVVLVSGSGATLTDESGRTYIDANSSIWTNLHGHRHPRLDAALRRQLGKVAHVSALGFANPPAARLAAALARASRLPKAFLSDDGSTAMETALKLAHEHGRRTHGDRARGRFLSIHGAYHGDTVGAVSLGHVGLFHRPYRDLLFPTDAVMSPYCYRCPFNRARPEPGDARVYRKCRWECVGKATRAIERSAAKGKPHVAFVYEPVVQGAAGMVMQPDGWLPRVAEAARAHGLLLVADEVMTGMGRTGGDSLFAGHNQGVVPDLLALAKGLSGGYLPIAVTMASQPIFDAFLGDYAEFKTFFHGHSYTGNPLGSAVALESMDILETAASRRQRARLASWIARDLQGLWRHPVVGDVRVAGLVAAVEVVRHRATREPFAPRERMGIRICEAMARRGVLTRPIGNVIVIMPPYCITKPQWGKLVQALDEAIEEVGRARP
ncbi:MAG: adenosylmethionine--8-amino-7-oxononanoate transaminase [Verrucomicrobiota bacterium]|jgi:adenosylmethionine-8-amino-7-oxononanoate aminotransferase